MRLELIAHHRPAQVALQVEQPHGLGVQVFVERLPAMATPGLGAIHRHVGIAQQFVGPRIARVRKRDPDRRRGEQLLAVDPHRLRQRVDHALRRAVRFVLARDVLEQDRELVPAEAGDHVGVPQHGRDPGPGLLEDLVARQVPHRVVDDLETIEVDEQHREARPVVVQVAVQRRCQPVEQRHPVRQPGQRVVLGLVLQAQFGSLALIHLLAQFAVGLGEFAGPLRHPVFEFRVGLAQ